MCIRDRTLKAFEQRLIKFEKTLTPTLKHSHINYYDLEAYIKNPEVSVVVAEKNEELIASGYGLIQKNLPYKKPDKYILLGFMYVIPKFRGIGINKRVMEYLICLLYTSPSPRDRQKSRMPSSA